MARIQLRGRIAGAAPIPTTPPPLAREAMWSRDGFTDLTAHTGPGSNELAISNGANVFPLVSHRRQVELIGDQTIGPGVKTFPLASLSILGGDDGDVLTTNGLGLLRWGPAGSAGTVYTFGRGLTEAGGTVDLDFATTGPGIGGVFVPTTAPTPPLTTPSGLFLNPGTGELRLAIAGQATLGGVYIPGGLAPNGGLAIAADGGLTLLAATNVVRGGVFVPPQIAPAGGLAVSGLGALTLAQATTVVRGGVYVPPQTAPAGGLVINAEGALSLGPGTGTVRGGCYVPVGDAVDPPGLRIDPTSGALRTFAATQAEATLGADNAKPITALVLQLGPAPATLPTNAKNLVGAITELYAMVQAATGQLTIVGTFDAAADFVSAITGSPHPDGVPLLPATQKRVGWFLLVDTAGTPPAGSNAPQVPMVPGDMVICVEDAAQANTYHWGHLALGQSQVTAANVVVTAIPGLTADNVQDALEELQVGKADRPLLIDNVSIIGDGQTSDLAVDIVDGGTF